MMASLATLQEETQYTKSVMAGTEGLQGKHGDAGPHSGREFECTAQGERLLLLLQNSGGQAVQGDLPEEGASQCRTPLRLGPCPAIYCVLNTMLHPGLPV